MKIFTIGFTKKSAETFFTCLREAQIKRLIDVRLNNVSQLAGFTKKDDLRFFTTELCKVEYVHAPLLAPTAEILDPFKKAKNGDWALYEKQFLELMRERRIEEAMSPELAQPSQLTAKKHRRPVYLQQPVAKGLHYIFNGAGATEGALARIRGGGCGGNCRSSLCNSNACS